MLMDVYTQFSVLRTGFRQARTHNDNLKFLHQSPSSAARTIRIWKYTEFIDDDHDGEVYEEDDRDGSSHDTDIITPALAYKPLYTLRKYIDRRTKDYHVSDAMLVLT